MAPLIKEYFNLTSKYKSEYGENTLVLMQVGAFFEVYGLQDKQGVITGSNIKAFSEYCDLATPPKHVTIDNKSVIMAGFRDYQLDKYLNKLQEIGYTTVVYVQDVQAPNTTRSLSGIYSPGTYFSNETKSLTNNTLCIWIERNIQKSTIHIGIANVDVYTGKTSIFEFSNESQHTPSTYDELERFVSIYNPSEVIIISNIEDKILDEIITFSGIQCSSIHKFSQDKKNNSSICIKNCEKQTYQIEIVKRFFGNENEHTFFDNFYEYQLATQAFCFLLDYIYKHNPNLVNKLSIPIFENCSQRLILANHSLKQLNIIDDQNYKGKHSSVQNFLNNCSTTMGKREFGYSLLNPIIDMEKLQESYDITEHVIKKDSWMKYRQELGEINDIEKLRRKLILHKINPKDLYILHLNLSNIKKLFKLVSKDKILLKYIKQFVDTDISKQCTDLIDFIERNFVIEICKNIDSLSFEKIMQDFNIFVKKGASESVDEKIRNCMDSRDQLLCIQQSLNDLLKKYEKTKSKTNDFIKLHETASMGTSLVTTQRRGTILKNDIDNIIERKKGKCRNLLPLTYYSNFTEKQETIELDLDDIQYQKFSSTNKNTIITSEQIKNICAEMRTSKDKLVSELTLFFGDFVERLIEKEAHLKNIIEFITTIDVLQCKCYNATKFNYCKPTIQQKNKSFVSVTGLRHCLIEHLQTNELYVTNDISLGREESINGMLLYGTNAVGKTSFIKSIGISIIMAQAGMYVPCKTFTYFPYQYLFTRILGNDNIFKGLSTFAVEMSELRTILKLSNQNSLILGDELCSGTESDSARSIFVAGLENLHKKESSFIFATHFHEITNYDEVLQLSNMCMKHMTVKYDKDSNTLIYDRKLKDGPGNNMYGLEVCKSLDLPFEFLTRAHDIRMKYNKEDENTLSRKTSHFNSLKVKGMCELCNERLGKDIHHLNYQKNANQHNYIEEDDLTFHKNHKANLVNICEECHDKVHKENIIYKKQKSEKGYIFTRVNERDV